MKFEMYNLVCLNVLVFAGAAMAADRPVGLPFATRSEVLARQGMAATSQPLATQVAIDILRQGGSAVDAAIAANATLGLMEPTGCGLGGDLFALVWDHNTGQLYGLNASGRAPARLTMEEVRNRGYARMPSLGPLPVTVPGCVDGWYELHSRFGKLPMPTVLAPAIEYARDGFPVSEVIAHDWQSGVRLKDYSGFRMTFLPNGRAPRKGDIFQNPGLARALELLAREGRDAFYRGPIADAIEELMRNTDGYLTKEDLAAHTSEWVAPVSIEYRGYRLWELPPNGQGLAALQMLGILRGFDLAATGFGSVEHVHRFVEAKKLAFEDRARYYADPAFHKTPVDKLISSSYLNGRRQLLRDDRAAPAYPAGKLTESGDTIYLTVADRDRNMVSLIQSNYQGFGSGLCPAGWGFCLQDRGELFSLDADHWNALEPRKRPFHTIIPAFITRNGRPFVSFGVMGGAMQPQGHVQIVMNLIDFKMNLQEAGDAPRIRHAGSSQPTGEEMTEGGVVLLENGFSPTVVEDLKRRGHRIETASAQFGGYQAILYDADRDIYVAASESRKDGQAAGF